MSWSIGRRLLFKRKTDSVKIREIEPGWLSISHWGMFHVESL